MTPRNSLLSHGAWTAHRWFAAGLGTAFLLGAAFTAYGLVFLAMSALTFCAYAVDKIAAIKGWRRLSERTLHGFELLCGWPGALIGQHVLSHKSRKASFLVVTWLACVLNAAIFYALARALKNFI